MSREKDVEVTETLSPVEKKLVALEMSKPMWQQVRKEAFNREINFSAMVRLCISNYFRSKEKILAKLIEDEKENIVDE